MTLVVPDEVTAGLSTLTLDQLAERANAGHAEAMRHMTAGLANGIAVGDVLIEVKGRLDPGQWRPWVETNVDIPYDTANVYLRLAWYREHLRSTGEVVSVEQARKILRGFPPLPRDDARIYPPSVKEEVKQLRESGMAYERIADEMGLNRMTVYGWLNPERAKAKAERQRLWKAKRKAERKALAEKQERQNLDRLAREAGGDRAKAYTLARRLCRFLDSIPSNERNGHWDIAYGQATNAAANIDKALRA